MREVGRCLAERESCVLAEDRQQQLESSASKRTLSSSLPKIGPDSSARRNCKTWGIGFLATRVQSGDCAKLQCLARWWIAGYENDDALDDADPVGVDRHVKCISWSIGHRSP